MKVCKVQCKIAGAISKCALALCTPLFLFDIFRRIVFWNVDVVLKWGVSQEKKRIKTAGSCLILSIFSIVLHINYLVDFESIPFRVFWMYSKLAPVINVQIEDFSQTGINNFIVFLVRQIRKFIFLILLHIKMIIILSSLLC